MKISWLPTFMSIFWALIIGIFIPLASSILPLQIVLSKNLNDALDYSHSKQKAALVKILRTQDFDKSPYIVFGLISVVYGVSIYYLMPLALISLNFSLLLNIFFMILIGMLFGLVLLTSNCQRFFEVFFTFVILCWEKKSMKKMILKNLIAHKERNRKTVIIFSLSIGFIIMCVVSYSLEIINIRK